MTEEDLLFELIGDVGLITLNRPGRLNALSGSDDRRCSWYFRQNLGGAQRSRDGDYGRGPAHSALVRI